MKRAYEEAQIELIALDTEDVLTTSGGDNLLPDEESPF